MRYLLTMTNDTDLSAWIAKQAQSSATAMVRAISATHLVRRRDAFGHVAVPARGSVLASLAVADWDPEPDYFFHWVRDSAIVMRTVADLMADAADSDERTRWRGHFDDFVRFSLVITDPTGANVPAENPCRRTARRGFSRFLRPDRDFRALSDDRLLGEPRFNADGTPDFLRWSRPQYDGPALRALACLRYLAAGGPGTAELERLLCRDLDFTVRHADRRCIGPWEEAGQNAHHHYTALVQRGALFHGRAWAGTAAGSDEWRAAERRLCHGLDRHWSERLGVCRAIRDMEADTADDAVDAATLLAVLDADLPDGPHSVLDPHMQATQAALESLFEREFPINRARPPGTAPALGRSKADRYFGGGAWFPTTLAAAALCYRRALCPGEDRMVLARRGDAFMATVRALTPADGTLPEQVDRATGTTASARDLTWSHAAFVGAGRFLRANACKGSI